MASSEGYLAYAMDLLALVPGLRSRKMMGEYLLYAGDRLFGGIYDDRLLGCLEGHMFGCMYLDSCVV